MPKQRRSVARNWKALASKAPSPRCRSIDTPAASPTTARSATTRVHLDNGKLVIDAGRLQYDLSHWHQDVFQARPRWPYEMESRNFFVSFRLDPKGQIVGFDFSTGSAFKRMK